MGLFTASPLWYPGGSQGCFIPVSIILCESSCLEKTQNGRLRPCSYSLLCCCNSQSLVVTTIQKYNHILRSVWPSAQLLHFFFLHHLEAALLRCSICPLRGLNLQEHVPDMWTGVALGHLSSLVPNIGC